MSWNLVRLADVAPQPWKNGGGTTRELLAWPDADRWRVRLSVAEVAADGPFSRFDGVQRWFAVLGGAGVRLVVDGVTHTLTAPSEPFAFDGAAATQCTLPGGATQDFNLMTRQAPARLQRVRGDYRGTADAMNLVAAYAVGARAVATFDSEHVTLAPGTLAWRQATARAAVHLQGDDALWMEVTP